MEMKGYFVVSCSLMERDCCELRRGVNLPVRLAVFHSLTKTSALTR